MKVFTYGTLMRGQNNNIIMLHAGGKFVQEAVIEGFIKKEPSNLGYPFIIQTGNKEDKVHGELWEVEDIQPLDWLEDVPTLYTRDEVEVKGNKVYLYIGGPMLKDSYPEEFK